MSILPLSRFDRDARRTPVVTGGSLGGIAAAASAGRYLGQRIVGAAADRRNFTVPAVPAAQLAPMIPAGTDIGIRSATPFVTSNEDFYRIDTALQVLTTEQWQLRIHGMVDREITLDWDDLIARQPIERVITLTCVSNEVGGNLAGNATWIGYPIAEILDEVGVAADADMLLSRSSDGYTAGTPLEVPRDGRDAILAVAMNGQPLPFEHGYRSGRSSRGCTASSRPPNGWWTGRSPASTGPRPTGPSAGGRYGHRSRPRPGSR